MKARIHLFEHDSAESTFFKDLNEKNQPIYLRFNSLPSKTVPCDLLVVHETKDFNTEDLYLIHCPVDDVYEIDTMDKLVSMGCLSSNLSDVFIGNNGTVTSITNVEKIVAGTYKITIPVSHNKLNSINNKFIAEYIYSHNKGEAISTVDIKTISREAFNDEIKRVEFNYFDMTVDDIKKLYLGIQSIKEMPILDNIGNVIVTNILGYLKNKTHENVIHEDKQNSELISSNTSDVQFGNVLVNV